MLLSFPEETDDDFLETVEFVRKYQWMNRDDYKINISLNSFVTYEVDWVIDHTDQIHYTNQGYWLWSGNKELTKEKRLAREIYLHKKMIEWNYDYQVTSWMNYIHDFSDLENILIQRYGKESFGVWDLYKKHLEDIEQKHILLMERLDNIDIAKNETISTQKNKSTNLGSF